MLTLICPVFNEVNYINNILNFFLESNPTEKEIYFIDGGSTDNTVQIIQNFIKKNSNIKLLINPNRFVPFALNLGIKSSKGDPIIRLDAHTIYSIDYCEKILEVFNETNADIVGGPMIKSGESFFQKTVAYCSSTSLGIGNSKIHQVNYDGPSDHVYLGAWKRNLFNDIGYFDENLLRNQDDEFHYRAKSMGKKIFLSSRIKSQYFPRKNLKKLFSQFFQYGLFKPLVLQKVKSEFKFRHIIPSIFVLYVLLLPLWYNSLLLSSMLFVYFLLVTIFAESSHLSLYSKILCFVVYPTIHVAYGLGFLFGLFTSNRIMKRFL
ncbi:MAG: glycosyltransferase family 2 protein [Ignavibacteriales bacterium]|nr:glycosyltransferase family 2 protein [Ignavibacteriales bacterium]